MSVTKNKLEKSITRIKGNNSLKLKGVNTLKYCGIIKLKENALNMQKKLRNEWK